MLDITQFPTGLITAHQAQFLRDFDAAKAISGWRAIFKTVGSKTRHQEHDWLGTTPAMQDITHSDLILDDLHDFQYTVENREYANGFEIRRSMLEDDMLGLVPPRISELAQEAERFVGGQVLARMATPGNAFDGTAFFADTRVIGDSANIDNEVEVTSAAAIPTVAEAQSYIGQAVARMATFQDDKARPMGLMPDTIVTHPQAFFRYWQALNGSGTPGSVSPMPPASASGVVSIGGYRLMANPYLTDVNDTYFFYTGASLTPFFWQDRVSASLESTGPQSDAWVQRKSIIHSARLRGAVGNGDPRHAVKIVDAGA